MPCQIDKTEKEIELLLGKQKNSNIPSHHHFKTQSGVVGTFGSPQNGYGIAPSGNYAFVADYLLGLQIMNVTNPSKPTFVSSFQVSQANSVGVSDTRGYTVGGGCGSNGFVINGRAPGDYSGNAISNAGDFNGDSFDNILIGAPQASPQSKASAGSTYLITNATNLPPSFVNNTTPFSIRQGDTQAFLSQDIQAVDDWTLSINLNFKEIA